MKLNELVEFEDNIKIGQYVLARFTNSYNQYEFIGEVTKINKKSVRVKGNPYKEPQAREFTILKSNLELNSKWSINNGVFPINFMNEHFRGN